MVIPSFAQETSKDEINYWKKKAKVYSKKPLALKAEFDGFQEEIIKLKQENKTLTKEMRPLYPNSQELIDSLKLAMIQIDAEIQDLVVKNEELKKQINSAEPSSPGLNSQMSMDGLVYRIQIAAFVSNELALGNSVEKGIDKERADGFNKYIVGAYRDYNEALDMKKQLEKIGMKEPWVVPYIDGSRVTMEEARKYQP